MGVASGVRYLLEVVCTSHCPKTLEKGVNLVFSSAMSILVGPTGFLTLVRKPFEDLEKFKWKLLKLRLKIDLVPYRSCCSGVGSSNGLSTRVGNFLAAAYAEMQ